MFPKQSRTCLTTWSPSKLQVFFYMQPVWDSLWMISAFAYNFQIVKCLITFGSVRKIPTVVGFGKYRECSTLWKPKTLEESPRSLFHFTQGDIQGPQIQLGTYSLSQTKARCQQRQVSNPNPQAIKPFKSTCLASWRSEMDWFLSAVWLSFVRLQFTAHILIERERLNSGGLSVCLFLAATLLSRLTLPKGDFTFFESTRPSSGLEKCLEYRTRGWETLWEQQRAALKPRSKRQIIPGGRVPGYRVRSEQSTSPARSC